MGLVAVFCVVEKHIATLIRTNLQRQGWIVFHAHSGHEALEHVRKEGATFLIYERASILPMTQVELNIEISKDPGDMVSVIDIGDRSHQPPTIFGNPKGPLPPAVAVRPRDWIARKLGA